MDGHHRMPRSLLPWSRTALETLVAEERTAHLELTADQESELPVHPELMDSRSWGRQERTEWTGSVSKAPLELTVCRSSGHPERTVKFPVPPVPLDLLAPLVLPVLPVLHR